jgi:UDP:flavonoid glycosyltransferase YjiC (YdhE family)
MRVLFTSAPMPGHFHPLLPFARALAAAGHEVAFAAPAFFAPAVAGAGFRHFTAGFPRPVAEAYPRVRAMAAPEQIAFMQGAIFADLWPRHLVPDLLALAATWPPDLLVREETAYGGCLAAERLGVPHATVAITAAGDLRGTRERIAGPLGRHRRDHGLAPDLAMLHRYLTLHPSPPSFHDPAVPVPPTTHFVRPVADDRSGPEALPPWVASLAGRPVVYVGMGTGSTLRRPGIFRAVIAGLRDEALTLIVTVGRDLDPDDYGPQPENVHIERYIPLSLLLPHCDLAVTRGGSGTLMAALGAGLPVVVVPLTADQPENAARCAALGLGTVVAHAALTPARAREAVLGVLGEPAYRRRAARLRDEIAALPGPEHAVGLLERLARERQPITSAG